MNNKVWLILDPAIISDASLHITQQNWNVFCFELSTSRERKTLEDGFSFLLCLPRLESQIWSHSLSKRRSMEIQGMTGLAVCFHSKWCWLWAECDIEIQFKSVAVWCLLKLSSFTFHKRQLKWHRKLLLPSNVFLTHDFVRSQRWFNSKLQSTHDWKFLLNSTSNSIFFP